MSEVGNVPGDTAENTFCPTCGTRLIWVVENIIRDGRCPSRLYSGIKGIEMNGP